MTLFHDVAEHCLPPCGFGNTDGVRAIYPGCSTVNGMGSKSLRVGADRRTRKIQKSLRPVSLDCFRLIGCSPSVDAKSRDHFLQPGFWGIKGFTCPVTAAGSKRRQLTRQAGPTINFFHGPRGRSRLRGPAVESEDEFGCPGLRGRGILRPACCLQEERERRARALVLIFICSQSFNLLSVAFGRGTTLPQSI